MELLEKYMKHNKDNNEGENIVYKPFAILDPTQLKEFTHGLLYGCNNLYDYAYRKTGDARFTIKVDGEYLYKRNKKVKVDPYLVALEAMLLGMFGFGQETLDLLDFGQETFFNEEGCSVKVIKNTPQYERTFSRTNTGDYCLYGGIIQIQYNSPLGSFVINQNQVNNQIYEIYTSEDISETLYKRINKALEIALGIKPRAIEQSDNDKVALQSGNVKKISQYKKR